MTERQRQVARGVALGDSVQELARRMAVQPQHVRKVLTALYADTGTRSQAGLVGWCVSHGLVTLAELQEVYGGGALEGR